MFGELTITALSRCNKLMAEVFCRERYNVARLAPISKESIEHETDWSRFDFLLEGADIDDVRWTANMLATVRHECANRWLPIEEFGKRKGSGKTARRHPR